MSKKHIIINIRIIQSTLIMLFCVAFLSFWIMLSQDGEAFPYVLIAFFIISYIIIVIMMPHYCVVSDDGFKIVYAFGLKESAKWNEIKKIYVSYENDFHTRFILKYNYTFVGLGGKRTFFMQSEFTKSKRLEKLLLKYAKEKLNKKI